MILYIIFYTLLFILWAIMWSFCGVIIERGRWGFDFDRLGEILLGRSYCPGCIANEVWWKKIDTDKSGWKSEEKMKLEKKYTLTRWQLIPLVGWLIQWGKCFRCKNKIPARYMWFEILMWTAFVLTAMVLPNFSLRTFLTDAGVSFWTLLFRLVVAWAAVGIFIADILWYELNVRLRLFLLTWIVWWEIFGVPVFIGDGLLWMAVLAVIFLGIYRFARRYVLMVFDQIGEGFGFGDVMMAVIIGLLFPLLVEWVFRVEQVQMVLIYLVVSSIVGMTFRALRFIVTKDKDSMMPFLPSMMIGFVLLMLRGDIIVGWL